MKLWVQTLIRFSFVLLLVSITTLPGGTNGEPHGILAQRLRAQSTATPAIAPTIASTVRPRPVVKTLHCGSVNRANTLKGHSPLPDAAKNFTGLDSVLYKLPVSHRSKVTLSLCVHAKKSQPLDTNNRDQRHETHITVFHPDFKILHSQKAAWVRENSPTWIRENTPTWMRGCKRFARVNLRFPASGRYFVLVTDKTDTFMEFAMCVKCKARPLPLGVTQLQLGVPRNVIAHRGRGRFYSLDTLPKDKALSITVAPQFGHAELSVWQDQITADSDPRDKTTLVQTKHVVHIYGWTSTSPPLTHTFTPGRDFVVDSPLTRTYLTVNALTDYLAYEIELREGNEAIHTKLEPGIPFWGHFSKGDDAPKSYDVTFTGGPHIRCGMNISVRTIGCDIRATVSENLLARPYDEELSQNIAEIEKTHHLISATGSAHTDQGNLILPSRPQTRHKYRLSLAPMLGSTDATSFLVSPLVGCDQGHSSPSPPQDYTLTWLTDRVTQSGHLRFGKRRFYGAYISPRASHVQFSVFPVFKCDLSVRVVERIGDRYPTTFDATWKSISLGAHTLRINRTDPNWCKNSKRPCRFVLMVRARTTTQYEISFSIGESFTQLSNGVQVLSSVGPLEVKYFKITVPRSFNALTLTPTSPTNFTIKVTTSELYRRRNDFALARGWGARDGSVTITSNDSHFCWSPCSFGISISNYFENAGHEAVIEFGITADLKCAMSESEREWEDVCAEECVSMCEGVKECERVCAKECAKDCK